MRQQPRPNEIYRHFKGKCYQILSVAIHSETMEKMVVYQQLYAPYAVYVRPLDMFMSEVDRTKYPQVEQVWRFEKLQEPFWSETAQVIQKKTETEMKIEEKKITQKEQTAENVVLDDGLLAFLEAESYEEKLEILNQLHNRMTDAMIDTMAVSLDVEIKSGDIGQRYQELLNCLLKLEHFECNRLR